MLFEASKHKYGLTFGHEASLVCLTGLAVSACMQWMGVSEFHNLMKFNDDLFFYFVLPPIVFASGFNMYRKKFFANIQNIVLFGVIGTFIAFGSFSGLTILYCKLFGLKQYTWDDESNAWLETTLNLQTVEILLMCSLLCSSDVIAAVSLIKPKEQPKLFSLVFGEGIVNDAVSIILFNTVMTQVKSDTQFTASAVISIGGGFCGLAITSLLIGFAYGLGISYLLIRARSMTKSPVVECALIFSFAYLSYVTAEIYH